ncbi:T-Box Transcription Factor Tbx2 [Manis pentadactyla]|nr:T-Box Transcription Factor Tbx2 [Manis pentadactyla]
MYTRWCSRPGAFALYTPGSLGSWLLVALTVPRPDPRLVREGYHSTEEMQMRDCRPAYGSSQSASPGGLPTRIQLHHCRANSCRCSLEWLKTEREGYSGHKISSPESCQPGIYEVLLNTTQGERKNSFTSVLKTVRKPGGEMLHVTVRKHKTGGNVFVLGRWEVAFSISIGFPCPSPDATVESTPDIINLLGREVLWFVQLAGSEANPPVLSSPPNKVLDTKNEEIHKVYKTAPETKIIFKTDYLEGEGC